MTDKIAPMGKFSKLKKTLHMGSDRGKAKEKAPNTKHDNEATQSAPTAQSTSTEPAPSSTMAPAGPPAPSSSAGPVVPHTSSAEPAATFQDRRSQSRFPDNPLFTDKQPLGLLPPIYEPPNNVQAVVDIVFVHGLTGNARTTWLYEERGEKVYWPLDLLSKSFSDARILAYGYDADVTGFFAAKSQNRIGDHAENMLGALSRLRAKTDTPNRRIIFVVHSLGGLVTENALVLSKGSPEPEIQAIGNNTIGIAFLGTPFHGSRFAGWATLASDLLKWFKRTNKKIVAVLEPDSEVLFNIQKGFERQLSLRETSGEKINIVCFYEELPVTGLDEIVRRESVVLPRFPSYGIRANHMEMTKFDSRGKPGFEAVEGEMFKWIRKLRENRREGFLESLNFGDMYNRENTIGAAYHETLGWIWSRSHIGFAKWLTSAGGIFWISGKPGSGKSTLTRELVLSSKIEDVLYQAERSKSSGRAVVICSSYFDYKASRLAKSAEGMFRTLLYKLVSASRASFDVLEVRYTRMLHSRNGVIWTLRILEEFLLAVVQGSPKTRFLFLIDALDEFSGDDAEITGILKRLSKACFDNLQLIVSSRPHMEFREGFEHCQQLRMQDETLDDIRKYATGNFARLVEQRGTQYSDLVGEVVDNADGMFIWVKLATIELLRAAKRGEDLPALLRRLRSMPPELGDFYRRMLDQLDPAERAEAQAMLSIVVTLERKVTPLELRYFVHFALGQLYSEFNDKIAETRLIAVCGGFLEYSSSWLTVVRLAHRSVAEFLYDQAPEILITRDSDGKLVVGEVLILKALVAGIAYMIANLPSSHHARRKAVGNNPGLNPFRLMAKIMHRTGPLAANPALENFCIFAGKDWISAAQIAESRTRECQSSLRTLQEYGNTTGTPFTAWRRIIWDFNDVLASANLPIKRAEVAQRTSSEPSTVDKAVGWDRFIQEWQSQAFRLVFKERIPATLLETTAAYGLDLFTLEALTKSRPLPISQLRRLLFAAARGGCTATISHLLNSGVSMHTKCRWTQACLARAIYFKYADTADLLLEHGADPYVVVRYQDIHMVDIFDRSPRRSDDGLLYLSSSRPKSAVEVAIRTGISYVRLLHDHGLNLNAEISLFGTAAQVARNLRKDAVLNYLIDEGANTSKSEPVFDAAHLKLYWPRFPDIARIMSHNVRLRVLRDNRIPIRYQHIMRRWAAGARVRAMQERRRILRSKEFPPLYSVMLQRWLASVRSHNIGRPIAVANSRKTRALAVICNIHWKDFYRTNRGHSLVALCDLLGYKMSRKFLRWYRKAQETVASRSKSDFETAELSAGGSSASAVRVCLDIREDGPMAQQSKS